MNHSQLSRLWPLLILAALTSCSKFQYVTISSPLKQNGIREFEHENDSVRIVYNFQGYHGPVKLAVYNKLDVPLFINWRMSSLIVDGKSQTFHNSTSTIQGSASTTTINLIQGLSSASTNFSGSISQKEDISFVPPKRFITASPTTLKTGFFGKPVTNNPARKTFRITEGSGTGNSNLFESGNSPFQYESYLTYSTDANFSTSATVQDSFWVSEILETVHNPQAIVNIDQRSDTFYNVKSTGIGTFFGLISLIGLLAWGASVSE